MSSDAVIRPFSPADTEPVYRMFRGSIGDYVIQIGLTDTREEEDGLQTSWQRQQPLMEHLTETAHEDWVAESDAGIVGWARSIERDGHVQLTHFFVDPSTQGQGLGRRLLEKAWQRDEEEHRSVIATQSPLALALYLRFGVEAQGVSLDFFGTPSIPSHSLDLEVIEGGVDDLEEVEAIERSILGYSRMIDLRFFAADRQLYLYRDTGKVVGYGFAHNGHYVGPAGVREPEMLPVVMEHLAGLAADAGEETFHFTLPANAAAGVRWALDNGYRIDPFYEMLLCDTPLGLDRFLMTQPTFIW